jgi:superfamily II DNA or RNA helicase
MRGNPNSSLRAWQVEALARYEVRQPRDFLATATPGAGKTTFALTVARRLLREQRIVDRVIVVAPTDHLRTQWADAATREGLLLDPTLKNSDGPVRGGTDGYVTTYAQVAARAMVHHHRTDARRTLVILDEIHHAGDGLSWGDAISTAFDPACRRLALTGTPFRTNPAERIPFVDYDATTPDELVSVADYTYGYKSALADGVVRPVVFAAYTGISRWMNNAGEVITASLSDSDNRLQEEQAWRTALDPNGQWVPHVLAALDERITYLRQTGMPDAAGLVLASDQDAARAYADVAHRVTGYKPVVILSDDPHASRKIERFATSDERLAICVRMVTEGVDIQRAAVLGYFTSYRTPLFFAQAVGRVVRARTTHETATVFLPSVRPLLVLAAEMEAERDHIVRVATSKDNDLNEVTVELVRSVAGPPAFEALGAEAEFGHVLHAGRAITAAATPGTEISDEDEEFLGLPGLLSPEQTATLLAARDADLRRKVSTLSDNESADRKDSPVSWRDAQELRRELNRLVAQLAARRGRPHAEIHVAARKAVPGPVAAAASTETLMARRDYLLSELLV